ncbi:MAG: aldose 1-epimerase [Chloroflexota bacterium]
MPDRSPHQSPPPERPDGWTDAAESLVRLTDPDGTSVAWVCPALGANVVAYAVNAGHGWRQVLHQDGPAALRERPSRFGLPILFPFPGHMAGGRYRWRRALYSMPMLNPSAPSYTHGFAHQLPWRVTEQTESTLSAGLDTRTDLEPAQRAGYPFDVTLSLTITLTAIELVVTLVAENVGQVDAPVGIGLHPYFDPRFFGVVDRSALDVYLPGTRRRLLTAGPPIPTGASEPADPATPVQPVPLGQQMLASRTDFGDAPTARIVGGTADAGSFQVDVVMEEGWEDVLLFAPADGPSISIEPHTCAPGASSLSEDGPDGQRPLAPGQQLRVRAAIRAAHQAG